jgi:hypothetical protein
MDILQRFRDQLTALVVEGYMAEAREEALSLSRRWLLSFDVLLQRFLPLQRSWIHHM